MLQLGALDLRGERLLIFSMQLCSLMAAMNTSMFNVALPAIADDLHMSAQQASWIVSTYSVFFAIGTLIYGSLANRYSAKNLMTAGLLILMAGTVPALFSGSYITLMASRTIQAFGITSIIALNIIMVSRYFPPDRKGAMVARVSSALALGFGLGPVLAGVITDYLGWPWIFAIVLTSILTLPVFRFMLPSDKLSAQPIDFIGIGLLCCGVVSLLVMLISARWELVFGLLFFYWFWKHIQRQRVTWVNPQLIKQKNYQFALLMAFFAYLVNFTLIFAVSFLLAKVYGATASEISFVIFPGVVCTTIISPFIGRWIDRRGPSEVLCLGAGLLIVTNLFFSSYGYLSIILIGVLFFFSNFGYILISNGLSNYMMMIADIKQLGGANSLMQLTQYVGSATGVVLAGKMMHSSQPAINILWQYADGYFSNIFFMLAVFSLIVLTAAVFIYRISKDSHAEAVQSE